MERRAAAHMKRRAAAHMKQQAATGMKAKSGKSRNHRVGRRAAQQARWKQPTEHSTHLQANIHLCPE